MTGMFERLDAIQERLSKADPAKGEWCALTDPGDRKTAPAWIVDANELEVRLDATYAAGKVASFIANAPSDVAFMLGLVRKQQETIQRLNRRAQTAESAINGLTNDGMREGLRSDKVIREYWQRAEDARAELRDTKDKARVANDKVQELARRLLDEEIMDSLDILLELADGKLRLI